MGLFLLIGFAGIVGLYFWVKNSMDHYKPLKPVELEILSNERIGLRNSMEFRVVFQIQHVVGDGLQFRTIGNLETEELLDHSSLMAILHETDYEKYIKLNMKNREIGEFYYEYDKQEPSLIIKYETF